MFITIDPIPTPKCKQQQHINHLQYYKVWWLYSNFKHIYTVKIKHQQISNADVKKTQVPNNIEI